MPTWKEIAPIVLKSCELAGCHGSVTPLAPVAYEGDEDLFKGDALNVVKRLNLERTDPYFMPMAPGKLTAEEKAKILSYCASVVPGEPSEP